MTLSTLEMLIRYLDRYSIIAVILELIGLAEKINKYVPFLVAGTYHFAFLENFSTFIYSDR